MKNIIYKHLKTCVLSLCVAVSCGDKAFGEPGVYFLCGNCTFKEKCRVWVKETDWIEHHQKEHKYTGEPGVKLAVPGAFRCGQCKDEEDKEVAFLNLEKFIRHLNTHEKDKKYGIKCLDCRKVFPWGFKDTHKIFHQCYSKMIRIADVEPSMAIYCKVCKWYIRKDGWNKHVHKAHGSDFSENIFVCPKCGEPQHQKSGEEVCCQKCGPENSVHCRKHEDTFEKDIWNKHVDDEHRGNYCWKFWCCTKCNNLRYQEWKGILCCQKCQYMYCQSHKEGFYGEKWNDHLKKEHKEDMDSVWFCPGCKTFMYGERLTDFMCGNFCKESLKISSKSQSCFCQICKDLVKNWFIHKDMHPKEEPTWLCLGCKSALEKKEGNYCNNCKKEIWCQCCKKAIGKYSWNAHRKEKHKNDTSESVFVCCDEIYNTGWGECYLGCGLMYCQPCKEMFVKRAWNDHVKQAHKGNFSSTFYACLVCLHTMKLQDRERHMREYHPNVSYCEFCSIVFEKNKIQDMRDHMAYEHPDVLYCELCNEVFGKDKIQDRENHMIEKHSDVYCEICHEVVGKNEVEKIEHCNVKHKDCVQCSCGVLYRKKEGFGSLKGHVLKKHTLRCEICGEDFSIEEGLKHMKKEHSCNELCKLRFDNSTGSVVWKHGLFFENKIE